MHQQSILNFEYQEKYLPEDFVVSSSNSDVFNFINQSHNGRWGVHPYSYAVILSGSAGCGKTHLSRLLLRGSNISEKEQRPKFIIIDDAHLLPEEELLHLFNIYHETRQNFLIVTQHSQSDWKIKLPDLRSRIKAIQEIKILEPDDVLMNTIIFKNFAQRYIEVDLSIINFLSTRLPRNFKQIEEAVKQLDSTSLKYKKPITIPLIKNTLGL